MDYANARNLIEDGDCISVRTNHGIFSVLTKFFTKSPYVHSGIAVWLEDGLWMSEINGGSNHLVPMSQLAVKEFDVYRPPQGLQRSRIRTAIFDQLRVQQSYGYAATLAIGLLEWLSLDIFVHWRNMIVCSGAVVKTYEQAGWGEHSYIISPGKLAKLLEYKLSVRL